MPNNYLFFDKDSSVITARTSITSGDAHEPFVTISSVLSPIPTEPSGNQSVSGQIDASLVGQLPAGEQVLGSVATLQGTNPWDIAGSVLTVPSSTTPGSVVSFQGGTWTPSVSGQVGASVIGQPVVRPYAHEASRVEGYNSVVSTSVTTLVGAAGASTRNYITDVWIANTGANDTLVTFKSGGGASVLGYTIAPAGGGSNIPGLVTPIRTGENETFDFQAETATSVLYATVKGFSA